MQAHSFFLGGVPMLFYGDEVGYTNDYSYLDDEGKSYDNRWMHRPMTKTRTTKICERISGTDHIFRYTGINCYTEKIASYQRS